MNACQIEFFAIKIVISIVSNFKSPNMELLHLFLPSVALSCCLWIIQENIRKIPPFQIILGT